MTNETTEPRIYIYVRRLADGQPIQVAKEIGLLTYMQARFPGSIVESEINNALAELGWKPSVAANPAEDRGA